MIAQVPITVSLPISTVVVPPDGTQVIMPIDIISNQRDRTACGQLPAKRPSRDIRGVGHNPERSKYSSDQVVTMLDARST
jgi:hypothetical protein